MLFYKRYSLKHTNRWLKYLLLTITRILSCFSVKPLQNHILNANACLLKMGTTH